MEKGLYSSKYEHDACGVGFIVNIDGKASHDIVKHGIQVLENLVHRGAYGGDVQTGDGVGMLVNIPHEFFQQTAGEMGIELPSAGHYAIGMTFLPSDTQTRRQCTDLVDEMIAAEELQCLGWRTVPVDPDALGADARKTMPFMMQFIVNGCGLDGDDLERKLYITRRQIENRAALLLENPEQFYIVSLSCKTVLYKGMMMGGQLGRFYSDLKNPEFKTAAAIIHQRYSTNTFPSWRLSQPFRYLAHNGEINTLRGNINQMRSREKSLYSEAFGTDIKKLFPIIDENGSDSACLDNALELLTTAGRDLPHAMMILIPQAWGQKYPIGPDIKGFFEYHAGLMEPWDGPAAVAFSNGRQVGALLDRNGLRPARYTITKDGFMILASETGVLDIDPANIVEKGALRPGQIIMVDMDEKQVIKDSEVKMRYARKQPYRRWVTENKITIRGWFNDLHPVVPEKDRILFRQRLFGYTREDIDVILKPMASSGHEPVGSMGFDGPVPVLSEKPQLMFNYFRQLFAQVTNPPIDPIREELIMSLMTFMGNPANILADDPKNCRLIKLMHPILSNKDLDSIKSLNLRHFNVITIQTGTPGNGGEHSFEDAIEQICSKAENAAINRRALIILSDKDLPEHVAPVPILLAVSAVNQRLIKKGVRTGCSIIAETGEAREVHHMALLLGYGATAINPYLAFDTIADLADRNVITPSIDVPQAIENYINAICKGLLKIMSKMGISTLRSYRSAQVFEAVGLSRELVGKYFGNTPSGVDGLSLADIYREAQARYEASVKPDQRFSSILPSGGIYKFRKDGERHLWTPEAISNLQLATRRNDPELYREYARLINDQSEQQSTLRGLFKFKESVPVPIDEVEPAENIMKRFATSAMSFGSISREAHETLSIAMNRIGAMSNSGEGGEDPARYKLMENGDSRCSAVKQIASGRFGVTIEYLVNARELQIKISQGAKPGEGGQLPGHKVNEEIARVRHSTPGVTLISPPPHHDIYSIEDIKQLIFDLKNANPDARISVKLVAETGVGTVAAGVAKAHADMILISGGDGGTGAAPLTSIKHAGIPWEIGLAETQQTLVLNNLRGRCRLQADGQIKTGRDAVIAALLGAEEFGFATAPLVVCGCVMMRKCHENTCPVGVATQNPELRKRYTGRPEYLVNFFRMLAEEMRGYMAALGFRTVDEMVGRSDMLEVNKAVKFWKTRGLDFSRLLMNLRTESTSTMRFNQGQQHEIDNILDRELIREASEAIDKGTPVRIEKKIHNTDRTTCTMLSGTIARKHGLAGLKDDTITCVFEGSAGQSFAAFAAKGLTIILNGEANDYVAKGLSGAKVIVKPPAESEFDPAENIIGGNVILYGATSGELYMNGRVGERFAIRNSGVNAVVEGIGDHGCEYMTGGRVVILGATGLNFGAGMSGGIAYIYDPDCQFDKCCNLEMVDLELLEQVDDIAVLKDMIEKHLQYTGSRKAEDILDNWKASVSHFVKVFPMEYKRVLGRMSKEDEAVERKEPVHG